MGCPNCGVLNPPEADRCRKCDTPLPKEADTLTSFAPSGWSAAVAVARTAKPGELQPGTVLANRYEIVRILGEGGMGAVYQARDRELDRMVALKIIRSELAGNAEILRRFKQELILARQVTHKNVIRIFDLGEAEGVKFITMEYIEGQDLRTLLRTKGKLPPSDVINIMEQVCRALDAAHNEGVIHRDLKPQNIMVDKQGKVYVMDFGIARSTLVPGMTQTGALIGTPEYMSPEQAKGVELDARSDLFSLGIIFYEVLTGQAPYQADTAMGLLWKRLQKRARRPIELDSTIPRPLSDIVSKCLEADRDQRYASAAQLLEDLESLHGPRPGTRAAAMSRGLKWGVAGTLALVLAVAGIAFRMKRLSAPPPKMPPVTLLIADFDNKTGDSVFDGTLEPVLGIALEEASFINLFNRGQARKTGSRLRTDSTQLDESLARLVALREGVTAVVAGSIAPERSGYKVYVTTVNPATGKPTLREDVFAFSKQYVLAAASKIAARIRKGLGDTSAGSLLGSAAETFTAGSIEAAHEYAQAQDSQWTGKWDEAIEHYQKATQLDPNMGRAYAGIAAVYANTGRTQDAAHYYQLAVSKIDRMTDRERLRTRSGYYLLVRNPDKAIDELNLLVKQFPSDTAGISNLALAYFYRRDMAHALELARRYLDIYPKNVPQRNNVGLYAMYAGDFDTAIREQQEALKLNSQFELAYVGMALSQFGKGQLADAAATYARLEKLSPRGASMAAQGLADLSLYEGRSADAAALLERGIGVDSQAKNKDGAAIKLVTLAQANVLLGKSGPARQAADRALAASQDTGVLYWAARTYISAGAESKAMNLARQLAASLEPDPRAYAKLIEAEAQLQRANGLEAVRLAQAAQGISDTWLGRFTLGRAYLDVKAFVEASSEFETCLRRRGEATAAFLDESPTYHLIPTVYYYLGRAQEGLNSPAAAESYKTFLAAKEKGGQDPLVADARRRLGTN